MAKIANIKDNGEVVYPITKPECVIDENGNTIKDELAKKADWNASEEEVGYIKNRTHYINYIDKISINTQDIGIDSPTIMDFNCPDGILYYSSSSHRSSITLKQQWVDDENVEYATLTNLAIPLNVALNKNKLYLQNYLGVSSSSNCSFWSQTIVPLDEQFIPDTIARKTDIPENIIKTTPQTLTDDAKNQALSNLGIDSIMLKYLKNPLDLGKYKGTNIALPEDIVSLIWADGAVLPSVLKFVVYTDESEATYITLSPIGVMDDNIIRFSYNSTTIDFSLVDGGDGIYVY